MPNSEAESTNARQGSSIRNQVHLPEYACLTCKIIADTVTHWHVGRKLERVSLGDWKGFVERVECETCQRIVRYFEDEPGMSISCQLVLEYAIDAFWITCKFLTPGPEAKDDHDHKQFLSLVPPPCLGPDFPHDISVDAQSIDISHVQQWLADCEANHSGKCDKLFEWHPAEATPSLTLIDIQQSCLIIPKKPVTYVTLSYVWGEIGGTLMATTHNINYLSTPGSLEAPETKSRIPRTILDAIAITRMMGVSYIWVDRLCIMQDNSRHFNEQLQQMASIYSNASFTIIAADGHDANHGLRGIGGQALPRSYKQIYYNFSSVAKLLYSPQGESRLNSPSWYTRAWTFQERAVSRRTLVFVNDTVYWQCRSATWHEGIRATLNSGNWLYPSALANWPFHALALHPWPDLEQYFSLVHGYNNRSLSFESDALKAFTAIINAFSRSFRNGFLFGVPEFLFDVGLLWSTSSPLKRRKDFPSWSWVGWSGEIKFDMGDAWQPESGSLLCELEILPVVEWEKIQCEDQSRVQIDNSYHIYRDMAHDDSDASLLQGWTKDGENLFVHPSIQGMEFFFPFPILDNLATKNSGSWSPLLSFCTEKCTMFLGSPCERKEGGSHNTQTCLLIELKDLDGSRVGMIESMFTSENEYIRDGKCELIAISKSSVQRRKPEEDFPTTWQMFEEMDTFPELRDEELYDFYNVLWIDWEGDIAYRKALGRVMEDAWERQDLKVTEVLLG